MEMKISEVAELYGVERQTIYLWLDKGLPYKYELEGRNMVIKLDLETTKEWVKEQQHKGRKSVRPKKNI